MIVNEILEILADKKAIDIVQIDMKDCNERLSDVCIIASGTSSRHMQSVADYVYRYLKDNVFVPHIEGNAKSGWILIDAGGIEVHMFKPEIREYYNLEELMRSGKRPSQDTTN